MPESRTYEVLATRYAQGLMGAASDAGVIDAIAPELTALRSLIADNRPLRTFLEGPNIPAESKLAILRKALAGQVEPLLLDFLALLLRKNRFAALGEIATAFERLVEERHNQIRVQVRSAVTLPVDALDRLKRMLDTALSKDCILETELRPEIIGGLVLVANDRVIDGSIRTALDDLRRSLLAVPL